jgi:tetratricopeptide (TPR) repeat protein
MTTAPSWRGVWKLIRARQHHQRALRLWRAGHLHRAQQHIVRAIALFDGASAAELAVALITLGDFQFQVARYAEAEATQRRAIHLLEAEPPDARRRDSLVDALIRLANSQRRQGNLDAAEATLRGTIAAPAEHAIPPALLSAANTALGVVYKDAARYAEAGDCYAAALATATHPNLTAAIYHNLAGLAHAQSRFADAVAPARAALALHRRHLGPTAPEVAADAAVLGAVLLGLGHLDAAEVQLRHAYRTWVRRFGTDHYEVAVCLHGLGVVQHQRGNQHAALRSLNEALRIKTAVLGAGHPEIAALQHNLTAMHDNANPIPPTRPSSTSDVDGDSSRSRQD